MYTHFYGLVERPFEMTPDPRYVYLSAHHKEALAHLKYGVEERKGFIQLTGEIGTGKTTMLDVLAHELDVSTAVAKLSYTTIDELDLLRVLAGEFGIDTTDCSKAAILELLRERLSTWSEEGKNAIFIVDEAQNLSLPVLEEIRLLSNLRANGMLSLQIVLAGQPELRDKLEMSDLRQLRQRIGIRYHLTPLSRNETHEYVAHRMAVAGATDHVFQPEALDVVYEHSRGVPRVINMVCDRALLGGYAGSSKTITADIVWEAIEGLEGAPNGAGEVEEREEAAQVIAAPARVKRTTRRRMPWAPAVAGAVAVVAIIIGAVFYFEGRERQGLSTEDRAEAAPGGEVLVPVTAPDVGDTEGASRAEDADAAGAEFQDEVDTVPGGSAESVSGEEGEPTPGVTETTNEVQTSSGEAAAGVGSAEGSSDAGDAWISKEPLSDVSGVAVPEGPYLIVAASTRNLEAARRRAMELTAEGLNASVWTVDLGDLGTWHRVIVGASFDSLASARRAARVLQDAGLPDAWVAKK